MRPVSDLEARTLLAARLKTFSQGQSLGGVAVAELRDAGRR
ncbi:hypothetical protein [Synechococcus sp. CCY 9618]|nr:hypothetical protein [Synechococcus sp. CCY 9618]